MEFSAAGWQRPCPDDRRRLWAKSVDSAPAPREPAALDHAVEEQADPALALAERRFGFGGCESALARRPLEGVKRGL